MPTLRTLLFTASGLYRDESGAHDRDELLARLPAQQLSRPIRLERIGKGVYRVGFDPEETSLTLFSRRRRRRSENAGALPPAP